MSFGFIILKLRVVILTSEWILWSVRWVSWERPDSPRGGSSEGFAWETRTARCLVGCGQVLLAPLKITPRDISRCDFFKFNCLSRGWQSENDARGKPRGFPRGRGVFWVKFHWHSCRSDNQIEIYGPRLCCFICSAYWQMQTLSNQRR